MKVSAKRNFKKLLQITGIAVFVFLMMLSSPADYTNLNYLFHNNDDNILLNDIVLPSTQSILEDSNFNTGAINTTIQQSYSNSTDISMNQDGIISLKYLL